MLNRGEIGAATVAEWDKESKGMKLPKRAGKKKKKRTRQTRGMGTYAKP